MEAEPGRQLADPPATWQEHWFDHRQLLRLYHSDGHCAIYVDPDVRRDEIPWLPRFISVTWQYSKATYGDAFGPDPRIYSCLLYTSPSPRDRQKSRMPSSA